MRYYSHFSILAFPIPNERVSEHVHEILVKQEEGDRTQWGDKTKWNLIRKTTKEKKKKRKSGRNNSRRKIQGVQNDRWYVSGGVEFKKKKSRRDYVSGRSHKPIQADMERKANVFEKRRCPCQWTVVFFFFKYLYTWNGPGLSNSRRERSESNRGSMKGDGGETKLFFVCHTRFHLLSFEEIEKTKWLLAVIGYEIRTARRNRRATTFLTPSPTRLSLPFFVWWNDRHVSRKNKNKKTRWRTSFGTRIIPARTPGNANPMRCRWLKSNQTIFSSFSFLSIAISFFFVCLLFTFLLFYTSMCPSFSLSFNNIDNVRHGGTGEARVARRSASPALRQIRQQRQQPQQQQQQSFRQRIGHQQSSTRSHAESAISIRSLRSGKFIR